MTEQEKFESVSKVFSKDEKHLMVRTIRSRIHRMEDKRKENGITKEEIAYIDESITSLKKILLLFYPTFSLDKIKEHE